MSPGFTLTFALATIFFIQGIKTQSLAVWTLLITSALFTAFARGKQRHFGLFAALVTFSFIFLGNYLPHSIQSGNWLSVASVSSAAIPASMRTAQIFVGLLWLATTTLSALTKFVSRAASILCIPKYVTALILAGFGVAPKMAAEYRIVRAALAVRAQPKGHLWENLKQEWQMRRRALFAVVARIFDDAASLSFSIAVTTGRSTSNNNIGIMACHADRRQKIFGQEIYKYVGTRRDETIQFARGICGFIPYFRPDLASPAYLVIDGQSRQNQDDCDWLSSHITFVSDDIWDSLPYPTAADHIKITGASDNKAKEWLAFFEVSHLLSRDVSTLSGGEKIRLA